MIPLLIGDYRLLGNKKPLQLVAYKGLSCHTVMFMSAPTKTRTWIYHLGGNGSILLSYRRV